ncbi:MAG TPA: hypothetical protein VF221_02280 [Chloroflexota bacterium]
MADSDTNFVATGPAPASGMGVDARGGGGATFTYGVCGMGTIGVTGVTPDSILPDSGSGTPDAGVAGFAFNSKNPAGSYGVLGNSDTGTGVVGYTSQGSVAIHGTNQNNEIGVMGVSRTIDPQQHVEVDGSGTGVYGVTGTGKGVEGAASSTGYGGWFSSQDGMQLHLEPSHHKGHPASGQPGDFFVDAEAHLWFCRGGTSWHRIV